MIQTEIQIRNQNHVVAVTSYGVRGEAKREPGKAWVVTKLPVIPGFPEDGPTVVGTVAADISEVMQRKLVLAMLEAL